MHILAILATVEALAILALGLAEWLHGRLDAERDRAEAEAWSVRWAHRGGNHAQ